MDEVDYQLVIIPGYTAYWLEPAPGIVLYLISVKLYKNASTRVQIIPFPFQEMNLDLQRLKK